MIAMASPKAADIAPWQHQQHQQPPHLPIPQRTVLEEDRASFARRPFPFDTQLHTPTSVYHRPASLLRASPSPAPSTDNRPNTGSTTYARSRASSAGSYESGMSDVSTASARSPEDTTIKRHLPAPPPTLRVHIPDMVERPSPLFPSNHLPAPPSGYDFEGAQPQPHRRVSSGPAALGPGWIQPDGWDPSPAEGSMRGRHSWVDPRGMRSAASEGGERSPVQVIQPAKRELSPGAVERRKAEAKRQRIAAEQGRRNELRDKYEILRSYLPGYADDPTGRMSKAQTLDKASQHIIALHQQVAQLQAQLESTQRELEYRSNTPSHRGPYFHGTAPTLPPIELPPPGHQQQRRFG